MVETLGTRIALLSDKLLELISTNSDTQLTANVNEFKESISNLKTTDVGVDTELVFRSSLDQLLLDGGGSPTCSFSTCSNKTRIVELLDFAIELGKLCEPLSFNIPKIPFLLIEDLVQCQTLASACLIWDIVESKIDTLTLPVLFNRGKFIILRTCNALLKRLSRSCHTEFCGRVLMFLASVYPLSEKSAVNLTGKVNVGNVTHFEDEESFQLHGRGVKDEVEEEGGGMEVEVEVPEKGEAHVDYHLYKAFWEIQGFLASDPKAMDQKNCWPDLMKSANKLLSTFEADGSHSSELKQARRRREKEVQLATSVPLPLSCTAAPSSSGGGKESLSEYMGCKFLTSSQLFLLELQDPAIRQQVAIQLLITLHFRLKNPASSSLPVKEEEFQSLEERLYTLLANTPSAGGDDLLLTLRSIFSSSCSGAEGREDGWLRWKQEHCPSFERQAVSRQSLQPVDRKRKRSTGPAAAGGRGFFFQHDLKEMQAAAKGLRGQVPSLQKHVEDFIDAEDPEAGIEDEYHPKHDTVYCWRARRLMASAKLGAFEDMAEGNVAKGLRALGMMPEPAVLPAKDVEGHEQQKVKQEDETLSPVPVHEVEVF